jgi:hypothetical protein
MPYQMLWIGTQQKSPGVRPKVDLVMKLCAVVLQELSKE